MGFAMKKGGIIFYILCIIVVVHQCFFAHLDISAKVTSSKKPTPLYTPKKTTRSYTPTKTVNPELFYQYKVAIKYKEARLLHNDHVGNSWGTSMLINNAEIKRGRSVTYTDCTYLTNLNITFEAYENDKILDFGSKDVSFSIGLLGVGTHDFYTDVYVVENRGRYSGNEACWRFSYSITISIEE